LEELFFQKVQSAFSAKDWGYIN